MEKLCQDAVSIFRVAVNAVKPERLVNKVMKMTPSLHLQIGQRTYPVAQNIYLVGFGKAVLGMAAAVEKVLGKHLVSGIISVPKGIQPQVEQSSGLSLTENSKIKVMEGAVNNMPDVESMKAAMKISKLVDSLNENKLLLVLISGGGSALLPSPLPEITLEEKQKVTKLLSAKGATIQELNTVRKRLSTLKGGLLALKARPAQVVSLIMSDIINDPLDLIASGPTVRNIDDPKLPIDIIQKYGLTEAIPENVFTALNKSLNQEFKYSSNDFDHVNNIIIGSNHDAVEEAALLAESLGYTPIIVTTTLQGQARKVGKLLAELAISISESNMDTTRKTICELNLPDNVKEDFIINVFKTVKAGKDYICLICGGETVVEVHGTGIGGRNQELALAAAITLQGKKNSVVLLSAGTDGIDGPTSAAGAIATPNAVDQALAEGINAHEYLDNNDSFKFYSKAGDGQWHVITGHTGTNVMDIIMILLKMEKRPKTHQ